MASDVPFLDAETDIAARLSADLKGIKSQGVNRLTHHVGRLEGGTISPMPKLRVEELRPAAFGRGLDKKDGDTTQLKQREELCAYQQSPSGVTDAPNALSALSRPQS